MSPITVHKRDHTGRETWHYSGEVLARGDTWIILEARFNLPGERDVGYEVFRFNDRYVERFFSDQWYNIWEVHDVADDHLKGWYCNVGRPAIIAANDVYYDDLALDVWVDPLGNILVLDEDEFAALDLDTETRAHALATIDAVQALVEARTAPFDQIT
ncbi:MAG: DUF402 domain-containing protein [Aggregatilineales bacterium]